MDSTIFREVVRGHNRVVYDVPTIETERLVLRAWSVEDRDALALINADPRVMEHFPALMSREQSDELVDRIVADWQQGFGFWAVQERASGSFIGFVGLSTPTWVTPFGPSVEIGWRLAFDAWGKGFATEAARRVVQWSKENVRPPRLELVSITTLSNARSRCVMEKLGFTHDDGDDFDHPSLPDWPDRRHVLYRLDLSSIS